MAGLCPPLNRATPPAWSWTPAQLPRPVVADRQIDRLTDRHRKAIMVVMADQTRSHFVTLSASRGSITLPAEVRHRYRLDQPGAQVQIVERDDGVIELHPLLPHRADQAWFWAERWQAMEQEAEEDIAAGRVETFDSSDEFMAVLEREAGDRGMA